MTTPRFAFPEAPPVPAAPPGFAVCPIALPAATVVTIQQLYQIAHRQAVEATRPSLYDRFLHRSAN